MQKEKKTWQIEMTTIFEGIFLFKIAFSLGATSFDDLRSNLQLQLPCAIY